MSTRWFVGLALASNVDAVDAALLEVEGQGLSLRAQRLETLRAPHAEDLTRSLRTLLRPGNHDLAQIARLHRTLGETYAAATLAIADRVPLAPHELQCIACPGLTLWHETDTRLPTTLSLGMPAVLAERLGVTVLGDLRSRDVAAGGHGNNLAALTDWLLFRSAEEGRLVIHLGSVARVVYLPARAQPRQVLGWETGPCNGLLDALMQQVTSGRERLDPGGRHAVQGKCNDALLQTWLTHPALAQRPPRSLARHAFGEEFAAEAVRQARESSLSLHDLLCTASHFIVRCIRDSLRRWLPADARIDRVLLAGGGVRNGLLWHLLAQQFARIPLAKTDAHGVPAGFRKATSFAVQAALFLDGVAGNVPRVTGAAGPRLLGSLTPGSPAHWARTLAWMAQQMAAVSVEEDSVAEW